MQNILPQQIVPEKFPCVVCSLEIKTLDELHNHQKHIHTTEELSLSVISLVHYIYLKNRTSSSDIAPNYPLLSRNLKTNNHGYHLRNRRTTRNSNDCATGDSMPPGKFMIDKTRLFHLKSKMAKLHNRRNGNLQYSIISSRGLMESNKLLQNVKIAANFNTKFISTWEVELGRVSEISDETFLKCVNGICKDLKIVQKLAATRRCGSLKPASQTNRTKHKKNSVKTVAPSQKSFSLPLREINTRQSRRSQTCTKSTRIYKSKENVNNKHTKHTTDYSLRYNDAKSKNRRQPVTLLQSFQILDIKSNNECLETVNGNRDSQGFDEDKQIPVLERAPGDFDYHRNFREMPFLEPQINVISTVNVLAAM